MIYDISQEIFSGVCYSGDIRPEYVRVREIAKGEDSNATEFRMNAHNATHIDAPYHRCDSGKTIDMLSPDTFFGECEVILYSNKEQVKATDAKRILFADCDHIDEETASLLVDKGVVFVGAEGLSIGNAKVHEILLDNDIVVLEGARLGNVPEGKYLMCAAPINLGGCDGAPCRALLMTI